MQYVYHKGTVQGFGEKNISQSIKYNCLAQKKSPPESDLEWLQLVRVYYENECDQYLSPSYKVKPQQEVIITTFKVISSGLKHKIPSIHLPLNHCQFAGAAVQPVRTTLHQPWILPQVVGQGKTAQQHSFRLSTGP